MAVTDVLTEQVGPLPGWVWALGGIGVVGGVIYYRKKKAAAAAAQQAAQQGTGATNLTVPVSNLTTQAQPMPIQLGDTFVNAPEAPEPSTPAWTPPRPHPLNWPAAANLQESSVPAPPPNPVPPQPASAGQSPGTG